MTLLNQTDVIGFSNLFSVLSNIFELLFQLFNKIGDTIADLWEFITQATSYVGVVTKLITSFIPPVVYPFVITLVGIALIKLIVGRDS